jgi:hypothetical protein
LCNVTLQSAKAEQAQTSLLSGVAIAYIRVGIWSILFTFGGLLLPGQMDKLSEEGFAGQVGSTTLTYCQSLLALLCLASTIKHLLERRGIRRPGTFNPDRFCHYLVFAINQSRSLQSIITCLCFCYQTITLASVNRYLSCLC